ncbi:MAG: hypothetical protein LBU83_01965 [Bacteroidales bacterium]|jgi:hypothetical protein|nr:hypothetical protein [Bacteroidales bacterium]
MNKSKFNEDFFANVREMEIWKLLSDDSSFVWSETLIDRYQDKIDWKNLSGNSNVQWSASMLEKYKNKLDWEKLSNGNCQRIFSIENLKRFSSRWDWSQLSSNSSVGWTMEKVEEFKDLIDWGEIIDCGWSNDLYTLEFFEKYKEYFPVSSLQQSCLWISVLEIYKNKLIEQILAQ